MKLRIQYMYENGNVSFADSIMTSKDASQMLNRAEYASQIAAYDRKMLKEYQATREKVNQKEQDLETEHAKSVRTSGFYRSKAGISEGADEFKTEGAFFL